MTYYSPKDIFTPYSVSREAVEKESVSDRNSASRTEFLLIAIMQYVNTQERKVEGKMFCDIFE